MEHITIGVVFLGGIATFLSPCFLPFIPFYIGYMTGKTATEGERFEALKNSLFFILGFTIVFMLLGAAASGISRVFLVYKERINVVLGVLVIIMGLFYMGIINIGFLNMEKRFSIGKGRGGFFGSLLLGAAIGFGWTPCISPILASVLALAASKASIAEGMFYLFIYSMGIGIPFLLFAVIIKGAFVKVKGILKYEGIIKIIIGVILVITGIMLIGGYFEKLTEFLIL